MFEKRLKAPAKICLRSVFLQLLIVHFSFGLTYGAAYPKAQQQDGRQALGSLSAEGEVYVNSAAAPAVSTVFAGDVLRTSGTGTATFAVAESGSFRISPDTEIVFAGEPQYAAELKLGKVVMNSLNGAMGITLRAGSSVVVAVAEGEQSTSSIEAPSDGSFLITCLGGSVGVVPLQGAKGIFITRGQSVSVSPQGELSAMSAPAAPVDAATATTTSTEAEPAARQRHSHLRWILIGAGVAGAGAAAAILSANSSGGSASSPAISVASPSSSTSSSAAPGDPAPSQPSPPQPAPPQPTPPQPNPPPPSPPNCPQHHHEKNCQPKVVIGFSLHF